MLILRWIHKIYYNTNGIIVVFLFILKKVTSKSISNETGVKLVSEIKAKSYLNNLYNTTRFLRVLLRAIVNTLEHYKNLNEKYSIIL